MAKIFDAFLVICLLGLLILNAELIKGLIVSILQFIHKQKAFSALLFIPFFAILSLLLIPASFPTLAAGVLFKPLPIALSVVLISSQVSLLAAFFIGRNFKFLVSSFTDPRVLAIHSAIKRNSVRLVVLLRMSPILPFGAMNYLFSITSIKIRDACLGTFLGNIPGAALYTYIGSCIGDLETAQEYKMDRKVEWMSMVMGGLFLVASSVYISFLSRAELRRYMQLNDKEKITDISIKDDVDKPLEMVESSTERELDNSVLLECK